MIKKNFFSIIVALIILYLSLANSESFDNVFFADIPYLDKIVHFLMYAGLMSVIILENRKEISGNFKLFMIALIPLTYGILMEILQLTVTSSRNANIYDIISNSAGIVTSALLWLLIKPHLR
jgi:VanZ family protein